MRTPAEVYQRMPITNSDGLDVTYRVRAGKVKNSVTAYFGKTRFRVPNSRSGNQGNDVAGIVDTVKYGDFLFQASYMKMAQVVPDLMALPVPAIASIAANNPFHFQQLGASFDPGAFFVTGEWAKSRSGFRGEGKGWYVSGGVRIGELTPYVTYAKQWQGAPAMAPIPGIGGQKTASIGLRWDVRNNVDLKLQYDRIDLDANSSGALIRKPGFQPGGNANILSTVVDFAF